MTPDQQRRFYGVVRPFDEMVQLETERLCRYYNNAWLHHLDQEDVNALWAQGRLFDFNPNWKENHNEGVIPPTAAEVNRWSLTGLGHDSINNWICVKAKCERLWLPIMCEHCNGDGEIWSSQAARELYENWERVEPPTGDGWQLWETVSEGSPVSPVFDNDEELVQFLISEGYAEAGARNFVKSGWSPSMMITPEGGVESGIDAMGRLPPAPAEGE